MDTQIHDRARGDFLEQQLQRANARVEQLLVALGRIQGIAPSNTKVQAVISEVLSTAIPYDFGNDDKATRMALATASAESLRAIWDTSEEDEAWQYLQPVTS